METLIQNQSLASGTYDTENLQVLSTIAEVTLIEGITATKTADRTLWANGDMKYTVTITNDTAIDYELPVFTDKLDDLITIVPDSLKVDGATHAYTFMSNTVTATLPTILGGESVVITFLVRKA